MGSVLRGRDTEATRPHSQDEPIVASVSKTQPCGRLTAFEAGLLFRTEPSSPRLRSCHVATTAYPAPRATRAPIALEHYAGRVPPLGRARATIQRQGRGGSVKRREWSGQERRRGSAKRRGVDPK